MAAKIDLSGLTVIQARMAQILLRTTGRESAMEFIRHCRQKGDK